MNRIVLKIFFLEDNGLRIELFHLDPRFLTHHSLDTCLMFQTTDYDFLIYSRHKLAINSNSFRLPDLDTYKEKQSVEKKFDTEEERYKFLKGLHKCSLEWNDRYTPFTKSPDYEKRNRNIIMCGEFWVI